MKILITGGLGYIGSKLVLALKDHDVEVFDKPQDIRNEEELQEAIKGKDIVYHLAALAELNYTDAHPEETYSVNIEGTNTVAKVCADNGVLLNFISTCCIYGDPLEIPSREDSLINPTDTYAMTKAAGEFLVKMWGLSRGLKYNILRIGTVYGESLKPEMRKDMAIQIFIDKSTRGEPIPIDGDGKQARNFIHIDDLVKGMAAITEKGIKMETINLAGKEQISINEIADLAMKEGRTTETFYRTSRKDDFRYQNVSLGKAKRLLNWQPEIGFADGFYRFYQWYENNQHRPQ